MKTKHYAAALTLFAGAATYAQDKASDDLSKRMIEGPQLCHRMKPVAPEVIRGNDFVAVKTTYKFEYAAPGRKPGSLWTQLVVFPKGDRFFILMDRIDSVTGAVPVLFFGLVALGVAK